MPPIDLVDRSTRTIACDYGTTNPCVFLDIYDDGETIRVEREYRWDSHKEHRQKTDAEYADDMVEFMGSNYCTIIVDPSAASFILELQSRGFYVVPAENNVIDGIRNTSKLFVRGCIQINRNQCMDLIEELGVYAWDRKAADRGEEKPVKEKDHAPDALRYYVNSLPDWRINVQT